MEGPNTRDRGDRARLTAIAAGTAWGTFAFGAVYPWAYWPLAVLAVAIAASCVAMPRFADLGLRPLLIAVVVLLAAIAAQLVPAPLRVISALSPEAMQILPQIDPAVAAGAVSAHSLSISPPRTLTGLVILGALAAVTLGATRLFSRTGVRGAASAVAGIGATVALAGILQAALSTELIYGVWRPLEGHNPFGPFVNKNHFAGWMLMAIPMTLGLIVSRASRGLRGVRPTVRDRILWFSTPDGTRVFLLLGAALIMMISLIMTLSRSGMVVAAAVASMAAMQTARLASSKTARVAGVVTVAAVGLGIVAWAGTDLVVARFAAADWGELGNRKGAWLDALAIARRYPITGTGFNTYGVATLFYQRHQLFWHYEQAHNDYLQLAAEGGLLLGLPALTCLILSCVTVVRRFRTEVSVSTYWLRVGAVTGLIAIALQDLVEFSLQMPGNAFLFAVLSAIALHRTPRTVK